MLRDYFERPYKAVYKAGNVNGVVIFRSSNPLGSVANRFDAMAAIRRNHPKEEIDIVSIESEPRIRH